MGIIGGGVWCIDDVGINWKNIIDGFFGGLVGVLVIVDVDFNIIYVGIGFVDFRGNIFMGKGVYKFDDGGKIWFFLGLFEVG